MTDYFNILDNNAWSLICSNDDTGGDDASVLWLVVGAFMSNPKLRVIGQSSEMEGPKAAIDNALKTIDGRPCNYLYEFKGEL